MAAASPHAADRYAYVPLSGPRQIRVLRLFKSKSPDDPLKGELFERSIDKVFPLYEAVSYTWFVALLVPRIPRYTFWLTQHSF
jgi:hypothetical protein